MDGAILDLQKYMKMKVGWAFELQFSELDRDHKLLIYCTVERGTTDPWVPT